MRRIDSGSWGQVAIGKCAGSAGQWEGERLKGDPGSKSENDCCFSLDAAVPRFKEYEGIEKSLISKKNFAPAAHLHRSLFLLHFC